MTSTDRTRLYRQRVKAGKFIAPVEIDGATGEPQDHPAGGLAHVANLIPAASR